MPKGKVSEFVVDAVYNECLREIERIKSQIVMWEAEITKQEKILSEIDDPTRQEHHQKWLETYKRNLWECRNKLGLYSHVLKD